jgi:hypothetical protein
MKHYYWYFLLFFIAQLSKAQSNSEQRAAKAVYLEVLGSGVGLSLNYDTRFKPGLTGLGLRAGIGGISGSSNQGSVTLISLPALVNYVLGNSRASFESGLGIMANYVTAAGRDALTGDYATGKGVGVSVAGNFGLRLQPKQNGVHFRLYWSPFITDHGLQARWLGLSLGYGFR